MYEKLKKKISHDSINFREKKIFFYKIQYRFKKARSKGKSPQLDKEYPEKKIYS